MDTGAVEMQARLRSAYRNVGLLALAQATMGAAPSLIFALGALAGHQLLGDDKSLATAPLTGYNIGVALGAVGAAVAAMALGRRSGFVFGALVGACGAALAAFALIRADFWLFALGLLLAGLSSGFTQKIRFAAADASPSQFKPAAISWILAAGIVSAVLGSQLALWTRDLLSPIPFAGAFAAAIGLYLLAIPFFLGLSLPASQVSAATSGPARPLWRIIKDRRFATGLVCGVGSYAVMTFLMTGAPLAMVIGCGFPEATATLGIQWHMLAMFLPSLVTGRAISRFGAEKIVALGLVLLMACAAVAHMGLEIWNFWAALVLLGIGWNFGFIGATAIVAASYRPSEADRAQGFHDIALFSVTAFASLLSGRIFTDHGWQAMVMLVWPVTILCLVLVLVLILRPPPRAAT